MDDGSTKRITLLVATVGAFLTPFDVSSVNVALPSIGKEFSMDAISLSWVATAYLVASAISFVPFGRIADIHGRKRIFTIGILTFTLASFSMVFCQSAIVLVVFRIIQGIGGAMLFGAGGALLTSVFPARERGKVLGIFLASVHLGLSTGPFLGGFLTLHFGWRSIFLVNVPLGLTLVALASLKMKGEWAEAKGEPFDLTGSIVYCLGLIAIMYGFSSFSQLPAIFSSGLILSGSLGILAFIKWEMKIEYPLLDTNLFRNNRVFAFSNLAALINYSATYAVTFFLSLYLQYIRKLDPQSAGLILVFQPIAQAFCSPFAGRLSDRIEPRMIASMGMALNVLGLFLLVFLGGDTGLEFIIAALILLGIGISLFQSPNVNAAMGSVEKRFYGISLGILATMRSTGQMFSMGITVLIFAIHIGHIQITPEYYPAFLRSMRSAFIFFAVLCCGGVFASFFRAKVR
jgi:EmrB/QacA subfamily drug resistance transporter